MSLPIHPDPTTLRSRILDLANEFAHYASDGDEFGSGRETAFGDAADQIRELVAAWDSA